jgi:hypothetical protein
MIVIYYRKKFIGYSCRYKQLHISLQSDINYRFANCEINSSCSYYYKIDCNINTIS